MLTTFVILWYNFIGVYLMSSSGSALLPIHSFLIALPISFSIKVETYFFKLYLEVFSYYFCQPIFTRCIFIIFLFDTQFTLDFSQVNSSMASNYFVDSSCMCLIFSRCGSNWLHSICLILCSSWFVILFFSAIFSFFCLGFRNASLSSLLLIFKFVFVLFFFDWAALSKLHHRIFWIFF